MKPQQTILKLTRRIKRLRSRKKKIEKLTIKIKKREKKMEKLTNKKKENIHFMRSSHLKLRKNNL